MSTVNFSVPDDVKESFNAAFAGQNKSAIIADLMLEAVERAKRKERSHIAIGRILACEKPRDAVADLADLMAVEFEQAGDPVLYKTACKLAMDLGHHLFDTLYHALALHTPGALLVTADRKYFEKAKTLGRIVYLPDLEF